MFFGYCAAVQKAFMRRNTAASSGPRRGRRDHGYNRTVLFRTRILRPRRRPYFSRASGFFVSPRFPSGSFSVPVSCTSVPPLPALGILGRVAVLCFSVGRRVFGLLVVLMNVGMTSPSSVRIHSKSTYTSTQWRQQLEGTGHDWCVRRGHPYQLNRPASA